MAKILHAGGSGYFPSCLFENSVIATGSLSQAMEIYWKVRSWKVTISGYITGEAGFTSTASDETGLVCESNFVPFIPNEVLFYLGGPFVDSYSNPQKYAMVPAFALVVDFLGSDVVISSEFADIGGQIVEVGSFSFYGKSYKLRGGEGMEMGLSGLVVPESYWSYGGTYDTSTGEPL
jgi:hypothetical protein